MQIVRSVALFAAVALPGTAAAQTRALVIEDANPWGLDATEGTLAAAGVPFDVIGEAGIAGVDPYQYTMIFVSSCQADSLYQAWNVNLPKFSEWVEDGGFLSIHGCNQSCGGVGAVFPNPPGAPPAFVADFPSDGYNAAPSHPVMAGLPQLLYGSSLAHTVFPNTGDPNDVILVSVGTSPGGQAVLFERTWGAGTVLVAGLTYEYGWGNNQDAGTILEGAVSWGSTFDLCDEAMDADGDGVGDACDACPGFDDAHDLDADEVPDDCDICPTAFPDDLDGDGICDDVDDSDGDTFPDLEDDCPGSDDRVDDDADFAPDGCDNCPGLPNATQADQDGDGIGDLCDVCVAGPNDRDDDLDGVANACDLCLGHDDAVDVDGDLSPDGCDNCPVDANVDQDDDDNDRVGDVCDVCPLGRDDKDTDADTVADACDLCDGASDLDDLDADRIPDACDNCVDDENLDQTDNDHDGWGRACDCDDGAEYASPDQIEVCDGIDNDCDGDSDEGDDAIGAGVWYLDADGDGAGVPTETTLACERPEGYAATDEDCDDAQMHVRPGATEVCDGLDNDCDGVVDYEGCDPTYPDPKPDEGRGASSGCSTVPGAAGLGPILLALIAGTRRRRGAAGR